MLFFLQEHFFTHLLRHPHFLNVFLNIALESFVIQMGIRLSSMILQPQSSGDSSVGFVIWYIAQIHPEMYAALRVCKTRASLVGGNGRISKSPLYLKISYRAKSIVAASTAELCIHYKLDDSS